MMYTLDGRLITDRATLHAHLRQRLPLPDYYGNNLDALYDALTEMGAGVIELHHESVMIAHLGQDYAARVIRTLEQAACDNPALAFHRSE